MMAVIFTISSHFDGGKWCTSGGTNSILNFFINNYKCNGSVKLVIRQI